MSENTGEYDPAIEEIDPEDVTVYEGEPDFDRAQADENGNQDDEGDADA